MRLYGRMRLYESPLLTWQQEIYFSLVLKIFSLSILKRRLLLTFRYIVSWPQFSPGTIPMVKFAQSCLCLAQPLPLQTISIQIKTKRRSTVHYIRTLGPYYHLQFPPFHYLHIYNLRISSRSRLENAESIKINGASTYFQHFAEVIQILRIFVIVRVV